MKQSFENILKGISNLNDNTKGYVIRQLKYINGLFAAQNAYSDSIKAQLTGVKPTQYNITLQKSIDLLKCFGFSDVTFSGVNPQFLDWFIINTTSQPNYQPKYMNHFIFMSFQQAYYLTYANNQGIEPTYKEVRNTLLTFDNLIAQYEEETKLSLTELINKLENN